MVSELNANGGEGFHNFLNKLEGLSKVSNGSFKYKVEQSTNSSVGLNNLILWRKSVK